MDLAAAAAGDRVTRMSLLLAGEQLVDVGQSDLVLRGLNCFADSLEVKARARH